MGLFDQLLGGVIGQFGGGQQRNGLLDLAASPETASAGLAALLPALVDQLTRKGQVEGGQDLTSALAALRGKLVKS